MASKVEALRIEKKVRFDRLAITGRIWAGVRRWGRGGQLGALEMTDSGRHTGARI